jgi:hypothetical protein
MKPQAPRSVRRLAIASATVAATALLASLPHLALANGAEVGRDAGMVFPVASDSVQLVAEYVNVQLPTGWGEKGRVFCDYRLRNLASSRRDFEMAFVTNPPLSPEPAAYRGIYADAGFQVLLDGSPLEVRYAPVARGRWSDFVEGAPDSLPVWRVRLAPRATARLRMEYDVTWSGGADGGHSSTELTYHARPAALWAGRIEEAEIHFEMDPVAALVLECGPQLGECFGFSISPAGYTWYRDGFGWRFEDWEPETDFEFEYHVYREMP